MDDETLEKMQDCVENQKLSGQLGSYGVLHNS